MGPPRVRGEAPSEGPRSASEEGEVSPGDRAKRRSTGASEEASATPTTGQVSGERSEVSNVARCHLPLCSFSLSPRFRASARNRDRVLPNHRRKRADSTPSTTR